MESKKLTEKILPNDWIKKQSKSRPDRYFFYNKITGESKWDLADKGSSKTKQLIENNRGIHKPTSKGYLAKSPAQERLKKLQSDLILKQEKEKKDEQNQSIDIHKIESKIPSRTTKSDLNKNLRKVEPPKVSLSSSEKTYDAIIRAPAITGRTICENETKQNVKVTTNFSNEKEKLLNDKHQRKDDKDNDQSSINSSSILSLRNTESPPISLPVMLKTNTQIASNSTKVNTTCSDESKTTSIFSKVTTSILATLNKFANAFGSNDSETANNKDNHIKLKEPTITRYKPYLAKNHLVVNRTLLCENNENQKHKKRECENSSDEVDGSLECHTNAKKLCLTRANDRLNNLKKTLLENQKSQHESKLNTDDILMIDISSLHYKNDQHEDEAMDWEPIPEEEAVNEINGIRKYMQMSESLPNIITTRLIPSTNIHSNFFVVIDTNVFLSNFLFITELVNLYFSEVNYPFLLIPYIVLQELDKLKISRDRSLGIIASKCIRYINNELNKIDSKICGQNGVRSNENIIEILNADDKIINCCLQILKTNSNHSVILLSNDINLRNKAIFNNIKSYSKCEFEKQINAIKKQLLILKN